MAGVDVKEWNCIASVKDNEGVEAGVYTYSDQVLRPIKEMKPLAKESIEAEAWVEANKWVEAALQYRGWRRNKSCGRSIDVEDCMEATAQIEGQWIMNEYKRLGNSPKHWHNRGQWMSRAAAQYCIEAEE